MPRITGLRTHDVRFPTARELDGSDAMNKDPDYSAAYVTVATDSVDVPDGHGFVFTIGRGNEVAVSALEAIAPLVTGRDVDELLADMGAVSRSLVHDSQLRWLGPEKGVMHMAIAAVLNALWDMKAKRAGLPLWQLLARMPSRQLVDLVDFRYISDVLSEDEALAILQRAEATREEREQRLLRTGYPAYTTSPGWLGYSDEKMVALARQAVQDGFRQIKLKVGDDLADDVRRLGLAREVVGPDVRIAIDANQRWDVPEAISWVKQLAQFDPYWIEEPTSPDDILGHAAIRDGVSPVLVATGEQVQNRIVFKQLLQMGAVDVLQPDAVRVAGVNENVAVLLMAAKFGVPICPHAGGVGLCEVVQHLSMFDYVAVSGRIEDRTIEYVDHLHEHFVTPVRVRDGHYAAPTAPGSSAEMLGSTLEHYRFPDGPVWQDQPQQS